jgi:hypothetical protein
MPCFSPNDPFCFNDGSSRYAFINNNTKVIVEITDNISNQTQVLQGNPNTVKLGLANETSVALMTSIDKANALQKANGLMDNIINNNQNPATPINSHNIIKYDPITDNGSTLYRGVITVDITSTTNY